MSARLVSSHANALTIGRPRRRQARLLELLYLACALLLGALLAATTLAAAPLRPANAPGAPLRPGNARATHERGRHRRIASPVMRVAPRVAADKFDSE